MESCCQGQIPRSEGRDREDFESFIREWLPTIRRFLYVQLSGDAEACDEVQQEVLIALFTEFGAFRGESRFSTYLYRLVKNKAVDHIRRERRRRRLFIPFAVDDSRFEQVDPAHLSGRVPGDPSERAIRLDEHDRLWGLIMSLPERDRSIFHLREIEELSEEESATILGIPVGTIKSRMHRIKKALYERMQEGES
jgi:RNA polymerase sigma-70 factor (ECF subfamily)